MQEAEAVIREQVLRQMRHSPQEVVRATSYQSGFESVAPDIASVGSGTTASMAVSLPMGGADAYQSYVRDSYSLWQEVPRRNIERVLISTTLLDKITASPFDELLNTKVAAVEHSLAAKTLAQKNLDATIGSQLHELFEEAREEYPETLIPSAQTMISALTFFSTYRHLRPPTLSLTPTGNVWAEWRHGTTHTAAIQFLRNGSMNLAAIYPHPIESWRNVSMAGNFTGLQIAQLTSPAGPLSWLRR